MSASPTIHTEGLIKEYGTNRVVDDVSINLKAGEIVGLLGKNGAGKSTTFKMLVGFTQPTAGKVFVNGKDVSNLAIHQRARLGIAYLPQETSVFRKMTVRENLMAILQAQGADKSVLRPKVRELLAELHIEYIEHRIAEKLSGGEKRRVEIARALMTDPQFLFLDEPFTGIDPVTVEDLQGIIKGLMKKGLGILITDHNVRETLHITNRSYVLMDGRVEAQGSVSDILASEKVRREFLTQAIVEDVAKRRPSADSIDRPTV